MLEEMLETRVLEALKTAHAAAKTVHTAFGKWITCMEEGMEAIAEGESRAPATARIFPHTHTIFLTSTLVSIGQSVNRSVNRLVNRYPTNVFFNSLAQHWCVCAPNPTPPCHT